MTSVAKVNARSGRFRRAIMRISTPEAFHFRLTRGRSQYRDVCGPSRSVECLATGGTGVLPRNSRDPLSPTRVGTPRPRGIYTCELRLLHAGAGKGLTTRDRDTYAWEKHRRAPRWWMNKYSRANKLWVTVGVRACVRALIIRAVFVGTTDALLWVCLVNLVNHICSMHTCPLMTAGIILRNRFYKKKIGMWMDTCYIWDKILISLCPLYWLQIFCAFR